MKMQALRTPNTRDLIPAQIEEALTKGVLFETVHHRKDGTTFPVEVSAQSAILGNEQILVSVIRDITERKQLEDELHRHRNHLEEMVKEHTGQLIKANKQLEKEIAERQQAETELAHFFTLSLDILCFATFDGYYTRVNPAFEKLLGYQAAEITSQPFFNFVHPEDRKSSLTEMQKLATGVPTIYFENRYFCKDGSCKWIAWTGMPSVEKGLICFVGRDITKPKLAAKALIRISKAVESSSDAILITDPDGRSIYHNPAFLNLFAYSAAELNAAGGIPVLYPDKRISREILDTIRNGRSWTGEVTSQTRHGCQRSILLCADNVKDDYGKSIGLIGIHTDVTDHKKLDNALQESVARCQAVFNSATDAFVIYDLTGKIIEANPQACKMYGYTYKQLLALQATDLLHPDNPQLFTQFKSQVLNTRDSYVEGIHTVRLGTEIYVQIKGTPLFIDGKVHLLAVIRDITAQKKLEQEMARLERLYLIGEMAAGIGHEIRNPMTTIRGFLQLLVNKPECRRYEECFNLMIEELDRANAIISEYLSLAKNKQVNLERKDLNTIIKALKPLISADAIVTDKYVQVDLGQIAELQLDEKQIRQLILNLVRNGLEAMAPGKTLTIRTFQDQANVVLAVRDQGKGIDPEVLKKIGTPFFTTKEKGTGLGLAVCYSIAARHRATIEIDTGKDGSTFHVRF